MEESKTFKEICAEYAIWVISYVSPTFQKPVFFVWYSDPAGEGSDKLLLFQTDQIWATDDLNGLPGKIESDLHELTFHKKFPAWLVTIQQMQLVADATFDQTFVESAIEKDEITPEVLERLVNFINLFGDYYHQLEDYEYFQSLQQDEYIDDAWEYFYNNIFWPNYGGHPEGIVPLENAEPDFDAENLLKSVITMRNAFEACIRIV